MKEIKKEDREYQSLWMTDVGLDMVAMDDILENGIPKE